MSMYTTVINARKMKKNWLDKNITIIFAHYVLTVYTKSIFFYLSTKKSTEWYYIQPTINTVYDIIFMH